MDRSQAPESVPGSYNSGTGPNFTVEIAIASWLHAKFARSRSEQTRTAYRQTLQAFRAQLLQHGLDLDAADPRRVRHFMATALAAQSGGLPPEDQVEDLTAASASAIALVAQAFAGGTVPTPYGARAVAPTTANRRLAVLSSFYSYALRQDLLRGINPVARLERRRVQDYAGAKPLAYTDLEEYLAGIDRETLAGKRDLALLLVGLYTGRRLSELWSMRREHLDIRRTYVDMHWPRTKGGKVQYSRLSRIGQRGIAGAALVEWVLCLYGEDGRPDPLIPLELASHRYSTAVVTATTQPAALVLVPPYTEEAPDTREKPGRPIWISLARRNGTFGHPLSKRAIADLCERRLGTSKVHTLRHTFARGLEDAGAKVSEIQAALDHESLATTGRYLQQLHRQDENPHLGRLSSIYGLSRHLTPSSPAADSDSDAVDATGEAPGKAPE